MKNWGIIIFLLTLLLAIVSPWAGGGTATPPTRSVRAWAIIDFSSEHNAGELWNDAGPLVKDRWTKRCTGNPTPPDDTTIIVEIDIVRPVQRPQTFRQQANNVVPVVWEAFALIKAADNPQLSTAETYIEACYSHVDLYRIDEELQ